METTSFQWCLGMGKCALHCATKKNGWLYFRATIIVITIYQNFLITSEHHQPPPLGFSLFYALFTNVQTYLFANYLL